MASGSSRHGTSAIISGLRRSFWTRGVGILLAVALNGWPFFEAGTRPSGFVTPAPAASANGQPFFLEEVVNPDSPFAMSHVSSLSELPDGRLAATWYAGSREGAGDVAIYFSIRAPADTRWSLPRAIVTRESRDARSESLHQEGRQRRGLCRFCRQAVASLRHGVDRRLVWQFAQSDVVD